MFNSIVVAIDGSSQSLSELSMGAEFAARDKSRLSIVYVADSHHIQISEDLIHMAEVEHIIKPVVQNMPGSFEKVPADVTKTMSETAENSQRVLCKVADHFVEQAERSARELGVKHVQTSVEIGNPADEILTFAKSQDADLIITGRRGFGPLKSLVLGSISLKIYQLAECNAMTVI